MKWGRKWGNYWGDDTAQNTVMTDVGQDPPSAHVKWDSFDSNARYHIYVDGKYYDQTRETEIVIAFRSTGRHFVEVKISGPGNVDEDITNFLETVPGQRARLTWTASASADINHYRIMWDTGDGSPLELLGRTKATEVEFITDVLADGTYEFRVDPVDNAGNITTSSSTDTLAISQLPNAPTNLQLTGYDGGTTTASFSFTESTSTVTNHRVYDNGGSGEIDYSSVSATITTGTSTFDLSSVGEGVWKVGIRAFDGTNEEDNTDVRIEFEIDSAPDLLDDQPNVPEALAGVPSAGAKIDFKVNYNAFEEREVATDINFYVNDGLGGAINYGSAVATASVPDHTAQEPIILEVTATSSALTDTRTYLCAAKAATSGGRESNPTDEISVTVDGSAPSDISGLSISAVNFEES